MTPDAISDAIFTSAFHVVGKAGGKAVSAITKDRVGIPDSEIAKEEPTANEPSNADNDVVTKARELAAIAVKSLDEGKKKVNSATIADISQDYATRKYVALSELDEIANDIANKVPEDPVAKAYEEQLNVDKKK